MTKPIVYPMFLIGFGRLGDEAFARRAAAVRTQNEFKIIIQHSLFGHSKIKKRWHVLRTHCQNPSETLQKRWVLAIARLHASYIAKRDRKFFCQLVFGCLEV